MHDRDVASLDGSDVARLEAVLGEGQKQGLLGPGPVSVQVRHALALAEHIAPPTGPALDLGTGGGLPGLVLAVCWPSTRWYLLDGRERSTRFVGEAVEELGLGGRCTVLAGRAELMGHDPAHRHQYDLVVARGFGPPAATAECGAPFLRTGGKLVVSEPPGGDERRWPAVAMRGLGLELDRLVADGEVSLVVFTQVEPVPDRFPRRTGVPTKRPLFSVSRETNT